MGLCNTVVWIPSPRTKTKARTRNPTATGKTAIFSYFYLKSATDKLYFLVAFANLDQLKLDQ
jgi:hypothetical protein